MKSNTKNIPIRFGLLLLAMGNLSAQTTDWDGLTFGELEKLQWELYDKDDVETLRELSHYYIYRGREANDRIEEAKGYVFLTVIEPPELGLAYADSIIHITRDIDYVDYPIRGYFQKAGIYYEEGRYREALENYGIAYELALAKENRYYQRSITMNVAAIRNINGQPQTAANLYHRALKLLQEEPDLEVESRDDHLLLLYNLSLAHLRLQQWDSAAVYVDEGLRLGRMAKDGESVRDFLLVGAQVDYFTGRLSAARDTLLKYMEDLEPGPLAMKLYYLGRIAEETRQNGESIDYFEQVDSLVDVTGEPFPEIREVYRKLIVKATEKGALEAQKDYIEKLIRYDSILSLEQRGVQDQVTVAYDIPLLKAQRNAVIEDLETRKKWTSGLLLLLVAAILSLIGLYLRNRNIKRRVRELIDTPEKRKVATPKKGKKKKDMPKETFLDIQKGLGAFEKEQGYLAQNVKLETLAKQLNTNRRYLSNFINQEMGMNFPAYLKELRIAHAVEQLKADPELLGYLNYGGLADRFGFGSGQGFSRAFYERTGVHPTDFLKELSARKNADDS